MEHKDDRPTESQHHDQDSRDRDAFMSAIEIAKVASEARKQCDEAKRRVQLIENLSKQAQEEYEHFHDVAMGIGMTATAVATLALKVCAYSSYKEAFEKSANYGNEINYEEFISVISKCEDAGESQNSLGKLSKVARRHKTRERSHGNTDMMEYITSQSHEIEHDENHRMSRNKTTRSFKPQRGSTDHVPLMGPQHQERRKSLNSDHGLGAHGRSHFHADQGVSPYLAAREKQHAELGSSSYKDFASEKFPTTVQPSEFKETMEEPFHTSIVSMTPLWEDRYIGLNKKDGLAVGLSHDPASWSEKKMLKQFQIKMLNATKEDVGGETPLRPQNPTPPEQPRVLSPVTSPHTPACPMDEGSDDEHYDDAAENLDDSRDAEISKLFGMNSRLVGSVKDVEGHHMHAHTQRLGVRTPPRNRPISPLLNKDEKINYVVREEKLLQQGKQVFQPVTKKEDKHD